jgi:hypothetical protein
LWLTFSPFAARSNTSVRTCSGVDGAASKVERTDRNIQIQQFAGFVLKLENPHKAQCGGLLPPELALQPGEPVAVTSDDFALRETPSDLDDVANHPLAESADFFRVCG